MTWRYLAGGVAAVLMIAAGWLLFRGSAAPDTILPAVPTAHAARAQQAVAGGGEDDGALPEASERSREQKRFDRYDKDRDATITREEYLVPRRKAFAKLDRDGDGKLDFDEWAVKTTDRFATADRDRSGVLDAAEFATTAPKRKPRPKCVCPEPAAADD